MTTKSAASCLRRRENVLQLLPVGVEAVKASHIQKTSVIRYLNQRTTFYLKYIISTATKSASKTAQAFVSITRQTGGNLMLERFPSPFHPISFTSLLPVSSESYQLRTAHQIALKRRSRQKASTSLASACKHTAWEEKLKSELCGVAKKLSHLRKNHLWIQNTSRIVCSTRWRRFCLEIILPLSVLTIHSSENSSRSAENLRMKKFAWQHWCTTRSRSSWCRVTRNRTSQIF